MVCLTSFWMVELPSKAPNLCLFIRTNTNFFPFFFPRPLSPVIQRCAWRDYDRWWVRWLQVTLRVIHLCSENDICLPRGCSSLFSSLHALVSFAGSNWELGIFITMSLFVMSLLWWQGVLRLPFSAREPQCGLDGKFNNIRVCFLLDLLGFFLSILVCWPCPKLWLELFGSQESTI